MEYLVTVNQSKRATSATLSFSSLPTYPMKPYPQALGTNSGELYGQLNCALVANVPIGQTTMTFSAKEYVGLVTFLLRSRPKRAKIGTTK
jgi:hypothetical protein